jgi:hypothetical protein
VAGVGDGTGEPVELGHHKGVAGPDGGQGLIQAGPCAAGAGETLVEVIPVVRGAERGQGLALGGEILQDGGAPCVADEFAHLNSVSFSPRSPDSYADWSYETAFPQVALVTFGSKWQEISAAIWPVLALAERKPSRRSASEASVL